MASVVGSAEHLVQEEEMDQTAKKPNKSVGERAELKQQQKMIDFLDGAQSLITVVVLCLCCLAAFSIRLFAVIRFESIIHEFDPWLVF